MCYPSGRVHNVGRAGHRNEESNNARSPFGVSRPNLEQPERDLLAPVRDLYEPYDEPQAWWTAHLLLDGASRPAVPSTVRRPFSDRGRVCGASAPACGRLVPGRINGDLDITLRTCLPPAIKLFMLLEAAMLRYCGIMATIVEGAVTRARDSARPAARRPAFGRDGPPFGLQAHTAGRDARP